MRKAKSSGELSARSPKKSERMAPVISQRRRFVFIRLKFSKRLNTSRQEDKEYTCYAELQISSGRSQDRSTIARRLEALQRVQKELDKDPDRNKILMVTVGRAIGWPAVGN